MNTAAPDPTRAIIYTRVSSDKAKGRSVKEQERECRAVCNREGWPVADVLTDNDRSATRYATQDRPQYARLRDVLQPGDVLVVWEPSRAGRSLEHYVDLRRLCTERGVLLSYSGRTYDLNDGDDRFTTGLDALVAEKEAEQARDRIMRAHRANLAAGRPHGKLAYGYRIIRDPDTGKSVGREPDPARAPLVREAARRVLDGQPLAAVARWLTERDPSVGWHPDRVRRVLTNPTMAGHRTHKGKITGPGTWEPILTDDELNDLTALFTARKTGPRGLPVRHLLSGIAVCGVCEDRLWRNKGTAGRNNYICRAGHVCRDLDRVDGAVTEVIEGILSSPEARSALTAAPDADPGAAARLAELRERLTAVEDEMTEGTMPAATGARVAARLTEQIAAAEAAAVSPHADPTVRKIATAPDAVKAWRTLPLTEKREFIRAVLTVTVHPIGRGRWGDKRTGIVVDPRRR
nr:recombinase family protein [Mycobacterium sp. UM_NZ2]